jgi:hypothetical protein
MRRLLFVLALASCSDPVTDGQISALPGENPVAPIGEFHRAGQPCVLCHNPNGPASGSPFAVAGTVFARPQDAVGLGNITVAMTDSAGSKFTVQTNCVGNFFVPRPGTGNGAPTWDPEFPIYVRIYDKNGLARTMQGQIGRERSCGGCHSDPNLKFDPASQYRVAGHLHMYLASDPAPVIPPGCPVNPVVQ